MSLEYHGDGVEMTSVEDDDDEEDDEELSSDPLRMMSGIGGLFTTSRGSLGSRGTAWEFVLSSHFFQTSPFL